MSTTPPPRVTLAELQRIKQWHVDHREERPLEYHLFDGVLTLWLMGWLGWLPSAVLQVVWAVPLCMAGMVLPHLYVRWRARAHAAQRLRCDWLATPASSQ